MAEGHGLHVEFFLNSVEQEFKSREAGRPIYEDVEFIKIHIPGDKNFAPERAVNANDKQKFALEYAAFKNGLKEEAQAVGTPLREWPAMTRSMAKEFAGVNVHTVEQLANLSDTAMQAFGMGAREWAVKAKAFLEVSGNSAAAEKYAVENEAMKRRVAHLEEQLAQLSASVERPKGKDKSAGKHGEERIGL